jgi:hypothetical protein
MNQKARMIDQPKRFGLRKPAAMAAGNEGNAKRVKAGFDSSALKQVIDTAILLGGRHAGNLSPGFRESLQLWAQRRMNRNCKILSWIVLATFGIAQPNSSGCQVDVFHWDRALGKPASGVERNFKADPHPFWFPRQFRPNRSNLSICKLGFDLLSGATNAESSNRIGFCKLTSDRFINQLRKEFDFQQGGIVADRATMNLGSDAPADIRAAVGVLNLAGINDAVLVQESANSLPRHAVTPPGIAFAGPMGCEIAGNPREECRRIAWPAYSLFVNRSFVSEPLSFSGINRTVCAQASGFLNPRAGIKIAFPKVPERGSFVPANGRHRARVSQSLTNEKWKRVTYLWTGWMKTARNARENPTITLRGFVSPRSRRAGLT